MKRYLAEMIGTMILVLMGCGVSVSVQCNPTDIASVIATALAFGLSLIAMAYTISSISGCHINPAVTLGVWLSKRMSGKEALIYMIFQVIGGLIASVILWLLTSNVTGLIGTGANDLQAGVSVIGGLVAEIVFTCIFVLVFLGTTAKTNSTTKKFSGIVIGLSLILVHLACIRYTGTSVNPARSIGPALFQCGTALTNLWIFIVGPFVGAALSAIIWNYLTEKEE